MEYSSPLAAMRPQACSTWGNPRDLPMSRSIYNGYQSTSNSSFDFKNMSMNQQARPQAQKDYFALKSARGSSPTSSLTADLDANFHIDISPPAPTPRRSLFATDIFQPRADAAGLLSPPEVTTPEIVSSSPHGDSMDLEPLSPLPHKKPAFVAQVTLSSPSPEETPNTVDVVSPDLLAPLPHVLPSVTATLAQPSYLAAPDRKRPVTRPTLSRNKGFSAAYITQRPSSSQHQLPPFRFGNVATDGLQCSSTPTLLESFTESPCDDTKPVSFASMLPPPRRPSLSTSNRVNGSPSSGHVRKPSAGRQPFVRPQRKLIRRSLSMFQHPDEFMKGERDGFDAEAPSLASAMDVDPAPSNLGLPHFLPDGQPDSLPRISQETLVNVLDGQYNTKYDHIMVIDCRFEYEYSGGHIDSAVNFNDKQLLAEQLFSITGPPRPSTLLIFHCEYSVHRAPLTAGFIRNQDRLVNCANYPRLTYPEMYILEGGYSKFFSTYRHKCFPQNYVEMNDTRHERDCERGMAKVKQRQKLFRHQTFAFGDTAEKTGDSPTAPSRAPCQRSQSTFAAGADIAEGIGQSFQRRMASY